MTSAADVSADPDPAASATTPTPTNPDPAASATTPTPTNPDPAASATTPAPTNPDPAASAITASSSGDGSSCDRWPPSSTFANPVVWQDFADLDVIRVGDTFYASASTMHYSPGAPVLRSYDLVNWDIVGHSVPRLDFDSDAYDLEGGRAYVKGIWASAFNYRASTGTFYWLGCVEHDRTYVYTSTRAESGWSKQARIDACYYDAGLLIDDDDTMYVAYGSTNISVAQLSPDGLSQRRSRQVYASPPSIGYIEGARFYKRDGFYYIFVTKPANGQYILRSTSPWGPYEIRRVLLDMTGPITGGGVPHQGGLVQTGDDDWYYLAFVDAYPGGRVPVLAPVVWRPDHWPTVLTTVDGAWGTWYRYPRVPRPPTTVTVTSPTGSDTFDSATLAADWEWNHNPDDTRWSSGSGLRLWTATVTDDLYAARNTLTRRIPGPTATATIRLDYSMMEDGDRAGLAMLRDSSAWIGVERGTGTTRVVMTSGLTMDGGWRTTGTGTEIAGAEIASTETTGAEITGAEIAGTGVSGAAIWLRVHADIRPGAGRQATFSYSTDGTTFIPLGRAFTLNDAWQFFMGYRFGIFNYATRALGGSVTVTRFDLTVRRTPPVPGA